MDEETVAVPRWEWERLKRELRQAQEDYERLRTYMTQVHDCLESVRQMRACG